MYNTWEELERECKSCKKCKLSSGRINVVIGKGNKKANVMFIGEGPGAEEDKEGIPFVGRAGKVMDMALLGLGVEKEDIYIANVVKCRPPGNRNPEDSEAGACIDFLKAQIVLVDPKIVVLLGNIALNHIIGKGHGITASRGKWIEKDGIQYMPTFHPAALFRDEDKKIAFWKDLKEVFKK